MVKTLVITNYTTNKKSRNTYTKLHTADAAIDRYLQKLADKNNRFIAVVYGFDDQYSKTERDYV